MLELPSATVQLNGQLLFDAMATLQVFGQMNVNFGAFNGSDAYLSRLTIEPGGVMNVGTSVGASFTLTAPTALTFADYGALNVGGQLTISAMDGRILFSGATVRMDGFPAAAGVNLIDNAGGTIDAEDSSFVVGAGLTNTNATLQLGKSGDRTVLDLTGSSITGQGRIDNQGTLEGDGSRIVVAGTYLNDGTGAVTEANGDTLSFQSAGQVTTIDSLSQGAFNIDPSSTLDLATNTNVGKATVQFTAVTGVLAVEDSVPDFTSAITGFSGNDALEIEGSSITAATYDGAHTVQVTETNGHVVDFTNLVIAGHAAGALAISNSNGNGFVMPCYLQGTHILTAAGETPVEALQVGDLVVTGSGNGTIEKPVVWIGRSLFDARRHPRPLEVWPIRIRANAIGENLPHRDLLVSPGHSLLLDGKLVAAARLVNGATIVQDHTVGRGVYFHIELSAHDIVLAEGVPAETYLDTGNRCAFLNGGAFVEQHPDFSPRHYLDTCFPLVFDGPAIRLMKTTLLRRAMALGHRIVADNNMHIIADGRRYDPVRLTDVRMAFLLPEGCSVIRLNSNCFVPAHVDPENQDERSLGICIGRLQIDGSDVSLDDPAVLEDGTHEVEVFSEGQRQRWTTGTTRLPTGARLIVIDLAGRGFYWSAQVPNVLYPPNYNQRA